MEQLLKRSVTFAKQAGKKREVEEKDVENNLFFMAVQSGNNRSVYGHLQKGVDPNATDENGRCGLHIAALSGHQDVFMTLLNRGADPEQCDRSGITPLMCAAQKGSEVIVDALLKVSSIDVSKKNKTGLSAVFYALKNGHLEIAKKLEEQKSCIHQLAEEPQAAIWEKVVSKNWVHIAEYLHQQKCSLTYKNKLIMACHAGLGGHTEMLKYFKDVKFDDKLDDGRSPLHGAVQNGFVDALKYMLENGCDVTENEECVHVAIITSRVDILKLLLDNGAKLCEKDENELTPLQLAVMQGSFEMVQLLMEKGCALEEQSPKLGPIAVLAATKKNFQLLKYMKDNGMNLDVVHIDSGETPLLAAAQDGPIEAVELLIKAKCNLNAKNRRGVTAALRAAHCKQEDILMLLGDNGAELDVPNRIGETPILCAARNKSLPMVRYLADKGCKMDASDINGRTLAYYAVDKDYTDLLRLLEEREVPLDKPDVNGVTPLMMAVKKNSKNCIKRLLNSSDFCDVNHRDWRGQTAAIFAAASGRTEIMRQLLNNKADLEVIDEAGNTLLLEALKNKRFEVVELLLSDNEEKFRDLCDLQATDNQLNGAVHLACCKKQDDSLMLLLDADVPIDTNNRERMTPFLEACKVGSESIIMILTAVGADTSRRNIKGENAAHLAAKGNYKKILHCLSLFGCAMDQEDNQGVTPLMIACENSNIDMVRFLIRKKVDVKAVDHKGRTPLHYACESGSLQIAECLIAEGADCNSVDIENVTPLMLAAKKQKEEFLKFLILKNPNAAARDNQDRTALHYAVEGNNKAAVEVLLKCELDPNEPGKDGKTAVLLCIELNHCGLLPAFKEKGGKPELGTSCDGWNATHFACSIGNLSLLKELQESKLSLKSRTKNKENCLTIASSAGHEDIVGYLLDNKVHANYQNAEENNALMLAAKHRHLKLIPLLLQRGVSVQDVNCDGDTVLHILCATKCTSKLDKLEKLQEETGEQLDSLKRLMKGKVPTGRKGDMDQLMDRTRQLPKRLLEKKMKGEMPVSKKKLKKVIKQLLELEIDVNAKNNKGFTPLHAACAAGSKAIVLLILERTSVALETLDEEGETPIFQAVHNENEKIVQLLIEHKANAKAVSSNKMSLMALAVAKNNKKIMAILRDANATDFHLDSVLEQKFFTRIFKHHDTEALDYLIAHNFNPTEIESEKGSSLLHILVATGDRRLLKDVLEKYQQLKSIINHQDKDGDTAFNLAMMRGRLDLASELVSAEADLNIANNKGHTPLHVAVIENKLKLVKWLFEQSGFTPDRSSPDTDSPTPLQLAAIKGNLSVFKYLCDKKFSVQISCKRGNNAVHYAATHGNLHIVKFLYEEGGNYDYFDVENNDKLIPFECAVQEGQMNVAKWLYDKDKGWLKRKSNLVHYAIQNGHQNVIYWLKSLGLNLNVLDCDSGNDSLRHALFAGNYHLVKELLPHIEGERNKLLKHCNKYGNTAAQAAAFSNQRYLLRWLHKLGAPMDLPDSDGDTPLLEAAIMGHKETLQQLHSYGSQLDRKNTKGRNIAVLGSMKGNLGIVEYASSHGVSLEEEDQYSNTALTYSSYLGNSKIVQFLLDKKCDPNRGNSTRATAAHYAAREGHSDVLRQLLKAGAEPDAADEKGTTPLMVATHFGKADCVKLLLEKLSSEFRRDNESGVTISQLAANSCEEIKAVLRKRGVNLPQSETSRPADDDILKAMDMTHRFEGAERRLQSNISIENEQADSGEIFNHPPESVADDQSEPRSDEEAEEEEENDLPEILRGHQDRDEASDDEENEQEGEGGREAMPQCVQQ